MFPIHEVGGPVTAYEESMNKIRVLTVDDSALMRQVLARLLAKDPQIEVVGSARIPTSRGRKLRR